MPYTFLDVAQQKYVGSSTTAPIFSDSLTTNSAWALQSGSATYSSSGATFTTNGTLLIASQTALGSGLTAQVTFTTPSAGTPLNMKLSLFQNANNSYELRWQNDNNLVLYKTISGVTTAPASSGSTPTESASTTYTFTLKLDSSGNLTGSLYSGTGTAGSLLKQLTATDTSLTGPFYIGVGGDNNVVATGASLTTQISLLYKGVSIPEIYIPLWWYSAGDAAGFDATTSGSYFLQKGSSAGAGGPTPPSVKLFTLNSNTSPSMKFAFECTLESYSTYTAYAALWDFTSSSIISSSQVTAATNAWNIYRSGQFNLTPGHQYGVTAWANNSSNNAFISDVSVVMFSS